MVLIVVYLTRPILRLVSRKSSRMLSIAYQNYINDRLTTSCDSSSFEVQIDPDPHFVLLYLCRLFPRFTRIAAIP